ncbi:MAG: hypothetical protein ABL909_09500 [Sphingopyxis sp.]
MNMGWDDATAWRKDRRIALSIMALQNTGRAASRPELNGSPD